MVPALRRRHPQRAAAARKRLKSQDERGRKALAADPRNTNAGWLTDAVARLQSDIDDLEKLATERELERVDKGLDWLEGSIVSFEEGAQREAQNAKSETGAEVKPQPAQESPEVKKVKAHFKRVMAEVKKLADGRTPRPRS